MPLRATYPIVLLSGFIVLTACQVPTDVSPVIELNLPTLIPTITKTPYPSATPTATQTPLPPTITPTWTVTPTPTETPVPTLGAGSVRISDYDGARLMYIPEGQFIMGSNRDVDPYFWGAEQPQHAVYLDAVWIYQTEVTNAMYAACVAVQECPLPAWEYSSTRPDYYTNPAYANFPVIYVSYTSALSYCRWAGGNLPTEAQWEKAARGTDTRLFPWGDDPPTNSLANYAGQDTTAVGSYPDGSSPFGVLDMAGNVIEWVRDYFQITYYSVSPAENPLGPAESSTRGIRGGRFDSNDAASVRVVGRASLRPEQTFEGLGFRCVIEEP